MNVRMALVSFFVAFFGILHAAYAVDARQAQQGESCNGFKKTCVGACPSSGGGALRKKCVDECNLTTDNCNKTGVWSSSTLQVKGLPTAK
jgi:hypothetical protein